MRLSKVFLLAIAMPIIALQTSCLESESVDFSVSSTGYMLQTGDSTNRVYTPYFYFTSNSSEHILKSVEVIKSGNGENYITVSRLNDYVFSTPETLQLASPDLINGTYYVVAKTTTGLSDQSSITLEYEATDIIEPIVLSDFTYNGGRISFTINEIPNIYKIGLVLTAFDEGSAPLRSGNTYYTIATEPSWIDGQLTLSASFSTSVNLQADYVSIRVFVCNTNLVYRESEAKILAKDGTNWVE